MNKFFQFLGILTFIVGIGFGVYHLKDNYQIFNTFLQWFGLLCLLLLALFIVFKFVWRRKGMVRGAAESFAGEDFVKALNQYTKELPNPSAATNAQLIGQGVNRLTRIGYLLF